VAGSQGGAREIIKDSEGDNEYNSETNKQTEDRLEECQVQPGARLEKGHLTPEIKMANDKLLLTTPLPPLL
jgi:hypothetical protein